MVTLSFDLQGQPREKLTIGRFSRLLFYITRTFSLRIIPKIMTNLCLEELQLPGRGTHAITPRWAPLQMLDRRNHSTRTQVPLTSDLELESSRSQKPSRTDKELSLYSLAAGAAWRDSFPTHTALSQAATLEKCDSHPPVPAMIERKSGSRGCLAAPFANKNL